MRRLGTSLLLPIALLAGCAPQPAARTSVGDAWVRLPAVAGRPGAAYFTLHGGATPARLTGVDSARVATIELHESMAGMQGMMTMKAIPAVDLPAAGTVTFAPQGRHAMLFGIDPQVKPGDLVPLGFRFADGTRLVASARAVAPGDPAPGG